MGLKRTRKVHVPADGSETFSGRIVSGEWPGGPYVELSFGGYTTPVEVINVYNSTTRTIDPRVMSPDGLRAVIREWIAETEQEWPGWYAEYLRNSQH